MRPAPDPNPAALDRAAVRAEMDQARADFRRLVSDATPADLRRPVGRDQVDQPATAVPHAARTTTWVTYRRPSACSWRSPTR